MAWLGCCLLLIYQIINYNSTSESVAVIISKSKQSCPNLSLRQLVLCVEFPQVQYFVLSEIVHVLKSVTIVISHFLNAKVSPEWRSRLSEDEIAEYSNRGSLLLKRRFARTFGQDRCPRKQKAHFV